MAKTPQKSSTEPALSVAGAGQFDSDDAIFFEALERPPEAREAFLRAACGGDEQRLNNLRSLLDAHSGAGIFLESPALVTDLPSFEQAAAADELPGTALGAYIVLERIGAGGMGAVYLADRADAAYEKQVAIKVIRRGMATDDILRRFVLERQVLANLDHPNIARLIDGGATADGRPFLVMEYVRGVPIDTFCGDRNLSIEARLRLFQQCCDAVQHAHAQLVIHRDLKPGNILVTDDGRVKLLDFGIAKLMGADESSESITATATDAALTPRYASPEQLRGERCTTAVDVHALGVILYELLTGRHPHADALTSRANIKRAIERHEPTRPSISILEHRGLRGTARLRRRLARRLAGDLDTIIMTAMHKDVTRRYKSVEQLSEDIRRHLEGSPVKARPDTLAYRASKFACRHAVPLGAVAALVLGLMIGLVTTASMYRQMRSATLAEVEQRGRAEREAEVAMRISGFLRQMLASVDPRNAKGGDLSLMRALLDEAAARATAELGDWPEVAAAVHLTIGQTYEGLDLLDEALVHLKHAVDLHVMTHGDDAVETARARTALGILLRTRGEYEAAEEALRGALATFEAAMPGSTRVAETLVHIAYSRRIAGDYGAAEELGREALGMHRAMADVDNLALATALRDLATTLSTVGRSEEGEPLIREALEILDQHYAGEPHARIATACHALGMALRRLNRFEEAEFYLRRGLEMRRTISPHHHQVAVAADSLASLLEDMGRFDEAEPLFEEALAMQRAILGDHHRNVGTTLNNLGLLCLKTGRLEQAEALLLQGLAVYREALGRDHIWTSITLENIAAVHEDRGTLLDAAEYIHDCLRVRRAALPAGHRLVINAEALVAALAVERGELHGAEAPILTALETSRAVRGDDHDVTRRMIRRVVRMYDRMGRPEDAARYAALLER